MAGIARGRLRAERPRGGGEGKVSDDGGLSLRVAALRRSCEDVFGRAAFEQLYRPVAPLIDPPLVVVARSPEGEMAGYCFAIPDRPNPELKQFVVKTLAVDPKWRTLGLGSWMVGNVHSRAHTAGWTGGGIHALMWTGSHSRQISAHAGEIIREYALFEKSLV